MEGRQSKVKKAYQKGWFLRAVASLYKEDCDNKQISFARDFDFFLAVEPKSLQGDIPHMGPPH